MINRQIEDFDAFTKGYIEAMFFTDRDEDDVQFDSDGEDDFAPETLEQIKSDCAKFQSDNVQLLAAADEVDYGNPDRNHQWSTSELAGHDFWFTRNHHGVGFWDRGLGEIGDKLTDAAHAYREISLLRGDSGLLYLE